MDNTEVRETQTPYPHKTIVAVDFDGTLVKWDALDAHHKQALPGAREAMLELKRMGKQIAIFTSRLDPTWLLQSGNDYERQYNYVRDTLRRLGIPFDFITGSKVTADRFIDDRAITYSGDWEAAIASYRSGISPYELGWLAGIFQGEGSITFRGVTGVELSVGMTDLDEVSKFAALVGVGNVRTDDKHGGMTPMYRWYVGNKKDVEYVLRLLYPFLGERRKLRAGQALDRMKGMTVWETETTVTVAQTVAPSGAARTAAQ